MTYLDDHPDEAKNASYYRRQVKELEAENERISAHNAMLVDALQSVDDSSEECEGDDGELVFSVNADAVHMLREALNATAASIHQWKEKKDAEARTKRIMEVAHTGVEDGWLTPESAQRIRSMADEVK
jgi:hypothetical protein